MSRAALFAGALALAAPGAQAQFLSGSNVTGCGGSTFMSCAIWHAALSNSNQTLTLTVLNSSNNAPASNSNSVFTQVILGNLNSYTLATNGFSATGAGQWSGGGGGFTDCTGGGPNSNLCGFSGFGLQVQAFGADAHGNSGIGAGQQTIFTFTFTSALSTSDFNDVQIAFHDQGTPAGCSGSSKAVFDGNNGTPTASTASPLCGGGNTVPEPESASLLALGLSALGGLGGLGRLRRRFTKA
jgi:hypothetical protein